MQLFAPFTIASLTLLLAGHVAAQDQTLLSSSEQRSLHGKLVDMIDALNEYETATDKARDKAMRQYDKAKEAFRKEWDSRCEKKGDLLASMPDLRAIFSNCFTYPRNRSVSIRKIPAKGGYPAYGLSVPKAYSETEPMPAVLLLAGRNGAEWTDPVEHFQQTWEGSAAAESSIFHIPVVGNDLDLDPVPDMLTTEGDLVEKQRIQALLISLGETNREYNIDRSRMFLDAGKDGCAFAVRAATYFPDRFAGLILRHPTEVGQIRLGSLKGLAVLLVASADTKAAAEALKKRFDELDPNQCTILDAEGDYPFQASAAKIQEWMAGVAREVDRKTVILEPNHDQFRKAYWVVIEQMDPLHTAPLDKRARLEATADRESNRLTIKADGIESIYLTLNDSLIDLDNDFTVVINDKAITEKRNRDFNRMLEYARQRFDAEFLFPVQFRMRVPTSVEK